MYLLYIAVIILAMGMIKIYSNWGEQVEAGGKELIEIYQQLPQPPSIISNTYKTRRGWQKYALMGTCTFAENDPKIIFHFYQKELEKLGWQHIQYDVYHDIGKEQQSLEGERKQVGIRIMHTEGSEQWKISVFRNN